MIMFSPAALTEINLGELTDIELYDYERVVEQARRRLSLSGNYRWNGVRSDLVAATLDIRRERHMREAA